MADAENSSIPLPSHIHYELLLQLLERETMAAIYQNPALKAEAQDLIITLRKAMVQQRQLEDTCQQQQLPIEYRWSLNSNQAAAPDTL